MRHFEGMNTRASHYRYTIDTEINPYISIGSSCRTNTDDDDNDGDGDGPQKQRLFRTQNYLFHT